MAAKSTKVPPIPNVKQNKFCAPFGCGFAALRLRTKILFGFLIVAALVAVVLLPRHILAPRVVASAVTPDGFEFFIIQQSSLDSLPWFTTSFVSRSPGGTWERFYFHHEDHYWGGSRVSLDTNTQVATFYRGSTPAIAFTWTTGAYTNLQRRRTAESQRMPSGWSPQMSVYSQ
jgi:hypothetical protein